MDLGNHAVMKRFVDAWLAAQGTDVESAEYARFSWAVDELFDLAHDNPGELLVRIEAILSVDDSESTVGALGAGVVEDLLVHHAEAVISRIENLCRSSESFRRCLSHTFVDEIDVSPEIMARLSVCRGG